MSVMNYIQSSSNILLTIQTKLLGINGAEFNISATDDILHLSHIGENMDVELFINFETAYDSVRRENIFIVFGVL
jgi:hypothetical protein